MFLQLYESKKLFKTDLLVNGNMIENNVIH
jgi:hypothetical protein